MIPPQVMICKEARVPSGWASDLRRTTFLKISNICNGNIKVDTPNIVNRH